MSITISNCNEICGSPVNNSPSKMLYTFPKTSRFQSKRLKGCDKYYDIPSTVSSCRTTSLGFGNKYDFTQNSPRFPPPNAYNIQSSFSPNKTTGFGFGKGRQEMQSTGPLKTVRLNKNPGPGAYESNNKLKTEVYSFNGKAQQNDKQKKQIPGPGSYPATFTINEKGSYFLSKYKNSCVRDFGKTAGGRSMANIKSQAPGPGKYDTSRINLSPQGKYTISRMKSCLTRKFAITTRRPLAERIDTPGPGNYKLPSEFGHYVSAKTDKDPVKVSEVQPTDAKQN